MAPNLTVTLALPPNGREQAMLQVAAEYEPTTLRIVASVPAPDFNRPLALHRFLLARERAAQRLSHAAAVARSVMTPGTTIQTELVRGQRVSHDFFDMLGVRMRLGRSFRTEEYTPTTNKVLVLSHGLWQRRFGSDPQIVGRSVPLNGMSYVFRDWHLKELARGKITGGALIVPTSLPIFYVELTR